MRFFLHGTHRAAQDQAGHGTPALLRLAQSPFLRREEVDPWPLVLKKM